MSKFKICEKALFVHAGEKFSEATLQTLVRQAHEIVIVNSLSTAKNVFLSGQFSIVFSEYQLLDGGGPEFFSFVRKTRPTPFVLMLGPTQFDNSICNKFLNFASLPTPISDEAMTNILSDLLGSKHD